MSIKHLLYSFQSFLWVPMGWLVEELGRHDKGGGSQKCPYCGACKESVKHVVF